MGKRVIRKTPKKKRPKTRSVSPFETIKSDLRKERLGRKAKIAVAIGKAIAAREIDVDRLGEHKYFCDVARILGVSTGRLTSALDLMADDIKRQNRAMQRAILRKKAKEVELEKEEKS